ncbi:MAG: hypothetical protein ABI181_00235 [Mycobacteriaceae bacterium]
MTVPRDPSPGDEGREPARPGGQPSDREVDSAFAALVADWDTDTSDWPEPSGPAVVAVEPPHAPVVGPADREPRAEEREDPADLEDEGHFERPDAPPVAPPTRAALGAIAVLVLGMFLVVAPGLIGLTSSVGFPLGLICLTGGLVFLLSRLKSGPPTDSGWDDGAQL